MRDAGQAPDALAEAGAQVTQWDMAEHSAAPELTDFDALVVLGGPMRSFETDTFPWLMDELSLLSLCLEQRIPVLGVCLGAQFICELSGGSVELARLEERQFNYMRRIGSDPLVEGFPPLLPLYNMHSDTMILPSQAKEFLVGGWCPQGVRFGPAAWGVQFHPEATDHLITYWHSRLESQLIDLGSTPEEQQKHYLRHAQESRGFGRLLFANFVSIATRATGSGD